MTHPADPLPTISPPSPWVVQHAGLVPTGGQVLDLAAGSGRHSRYFNSLGYSVLAVDRDVNGLAELRGQSGIELLELDLETTNVWPLAGRFFAGIVVTNYLHRPLLPHLAASLTPGGVLIYETFAIGNEGFGRPSNPNFLLRPGELLELAGTSGLTVLAYEQVEARQPRPAVIQHIVARNDAQSIS
jgi:SAM-dependent methyltransferase